jgi:nitroreductase
MEAAIRAPSGGNAQPWHWIVVRDAARRRRFGELYNEAWWAKRRDAGVMGPEGIPPGKGVTQSAMRLADEMGEAPCIVVLCATSGGPGPRESVIPAAQNLLLAARSCGVGGTITTIHPQVEERARALLGVPDVAQIVYAIPLGYPSGGFGGAQRRPLAEVCSYDRWGQPQNA